MKPSPPRSIQERCVAAALARRWRLGTAESCTGGLIASLLVSVPGASQVFAGSVVAYGDDIKAEALGVPRELIAARGAVSAEVAVGMAEGLRGRWALDAVVATTGIAGPAGAAPGKPVGLVFIALAHPGGTDLERHVFQGGRESVRNGAAARGMAMLLARMEQE